jgi:putative ABC transport system ATP-binding protein
MVTHDPVAATIADRVLLLADGKIARTLARPTQAKVIDAIQEVAGR